MRRFVLLLALLAVGTGLLCGRAFAEDEEEPEGEPPEAEMPGVVELSE